MADTTKGVIIWRGDAGNPESHYSKSQISDVTDDTALQTLVTALLPYSDCNAAKTSFVANTLGTDSEPGADALVDLKAVCYMRDPDTLRVHSVTIPAPVATMYTTEDQGDRVTSAALTAIVGAINTATGKSYTALYGVIIQKR